VNPSFGILLLMTTPVIVGVDCAIAKVRKKNVDKIGKVQDKLFNRNFI
jgi:hypothetical protein